MTSVTWRAVCSCSHKNEHWSTTGSIFACWGATSRVSKSSQWRDLCTLLAMMWQSKHAPTRAFQKAVMSLFQELEVNFGCFGHFGQIGEEGNLKSFCHFHSGVESQLGFEFLLVNLPQLLARTKTRGCLFLQTGRRKTNAPGYEHLFSGGCFFSRAFCHLVILLTSWVVKCQRFCQQKAAPLGRSLNLEVVVCNQSPSIPSETATFLRLWNPEPVGWRAATFLNHRIMRTDKPHLSSCSLHEAKLLEMKLKLLKALTAVVAGFPQRSLLASLRTELGPPQPDHSVWSSSGGIKSHSNYMLLMCINIP